MSRLKKIFIAIAGGLSLVIVSFLITICNVKSNVSIAFNSPYSVVIFNNSTKGEEYKTDANLEILQEEINKLTNLTVYNKLVNGFSLTKNIEMDTSGKFTKYSTDLLNKNLVIEFIYTTEQDLVVYEDGNSRVISFYCLLLVIPKVDDCTEIAVYYSNTSNTENNEKNDSYATNTPLILHGNAKDFINQIKNLKTEA